MYKIIWREREREKEKGSSRAIWTLYCWEGGVTLYALQEANFENKLWLKAISLNICSTRPPTSNINLSKSRYSNYTYIQCILMYSHALLLHFRIHTSGEILSILLRDNFVFAIYRFRFGEEKWTVMKMLTYWFKCFEE